MSHTHTMDEAHTMKAPEAAALAGIGTNALYEAIKRGEVPGVLRIGRSIRISRKVFLAWLDGGAEAA